MPGHFGVAGNEWAGVVAKEADCTVALPYSDYVFRLGKAVKTALKGSGRSHECSISGACRTKNELRQLPSFSMPQPSSSLKRLSAACVRIGHIWLTHGF